MFIQRYLLSVVWLDFRLALSNMPLMHILAFLCEDRMSAFQHDVVPISNYFKMEMQTLYGKNGIRH